MFTDLYDVARHTPMTILLAPAGDQLRVIVIPKPSGNAADVAALKQPITAQGTPAELDAELPALLRQYAGTVNDVRATMSLPLDALAEAKAKAEKKAEKKTTPAPTKPTPRPAAKKATARPVRVAQKLPTPKPATARRPPPPHAPPARSPKHQLGKPNKAKVIADFHAMRAAHGEALNRALFIEKSATKRRYEKLWKNWEAFIAEAEQHPPAIGHTTGQAIDTLGQAPHNEGERRAEPLSDTGRDIGSERTEATRLDPVQAWPFPTAAASPAPAPAPAPVPSPKPRLRPDGNGGFVPVTPE